MTDAIYKEILEREKNNNIPTGNYRGVIYELISPNTLLYEEFGLCTQVM